ncbi:MAG TPA: AcvB/VirJ family lysyl-phosphatidylglycerol hydrolase [Vicinamibacterales bacterium]|nr:AcvB/VirJ family lysyl-phosphatidylglycerol hydrolase [Vicinamibacterales bacterium]
MDSASVTRAGLTALLAFAATPAIAHESIAIPVRGHTVTVAYYRCAAGGAPKGTIIIGSGDVGWVGLGSELAEFLSDEGYVTVGINVREYLEMFSTGASHVTPDDVGSDYATIAASLRDRGLLPSPVIVSGVSEGAAMAVLAGAAPGNHAWIRGVMTLGLPPTAEMAWHWRDAATWFTKKDAEEPSIAPKDFVARVAPLPLWMIQSTKDEYVTPADYALIDRMAQSPKQLTLIAASNHRFTDQKPELHKQVLAGLAWINLELRTSN